MISSFVVPAGLLALTALTGHVARPLPDDVEAFLRVYPWIVLVAGALLGLRFRRGRVVVAVVAIAVADRILLRFGAGPAGEGAARWAFDATAFLLPLDLGWLGMARERGALTPRGLGRLALIAAQPAVASLIWLSYQPRLVSLLGGRVFPAGFAPATRMPDLALLAFAGSFAAVAVLCALRRNAIEAGFLWALVACFLALESGRSASLYLATGGLILIVALLESTFAMAFRDPLTGLASRRAFDEAIEKLAAAYVIAMVDVDQLQGRQRPPRPRRGRRDPAHGRLPARGGRKRRARVSRRRRGVRARFREPLARRGSRRCRESPGGDRRVALRAALARPLPPGGRNGSQVARNRRRRSA